MSNHITRYLTLTTAITLCPDLDKHFDNFQLSCYTSIRPLCFFHLLLQGEKNCLHIFRTETMPAERNWTPMAWREAITASPFRLPESPRLRSLIEWHYRMLVINSWGSLGLRQLVRAGFREA